MKITVETIVRAHIAKVWSAYTRPADIKQWNTASDDWHTTQSTVDLSEGGAFSSRMEAKDGSFGFDFAGTYTKIVPLQRIEYAFGDRTGTVEFLVGANNVTVRSTFDAETQNPVEQQRQGWQAILNNFAKHVEAGHSIRTCLWFRDGRGREAAEFYCSLIPGSRVETTFSADAGHGAFSVIDFTLGGVPYQILDAGPMFTLTEAVSISVATDDQAESDRLWMALTDNGGQESHCGWLKDRFGVSWQVYPKRLTELTTSADKNVSAKAMAAMMKQMKINIAEIEAAVREAQ